MNSLHVSDIPKFGKWLGSKGFKSAERADYEQKRWEHPTLGKVIIYSRKLANPYPKINDNGYKLFLEFEASHEQ